jgi:hypothetical protein
MRGGSVIYSYNLLPLSGSCPAEFMTTSYCLIWDYWLSYCSLIRLAGLLWRYSNPPTHCRSLELNCSKIVVITWRWPLTKAETCRYHGEHEIKHNLLIVANEGFVLWFVPRAFAYINPGVDQKENNRSIVSELLFYTAGTWAPGQPRWHILLSLCYPGDGGFV